MHPCGGLTGFGAEPLIRRHPGAFVRGGALQLEGVVGHEGHNLLLCERQRGMRIPQVGQDPPEQLFVVAALQVPAAPATRRPNGPRTTLFALRPGTPVPQEEILLSRQRRHQRAVLGHRAAAGAPKLPVGLFAEERSEVAFQARAIIAPPSASS